MDRARLVTEGRALPADQRPFDETPVDTDDLPPTPVRDRNIAASAWRQAPQRLLELGADIAVASQRTAYKRRLGTWLLWRAGPAKGADARYLAIDSTDLSRMFEMRMFPDGSASGAGPSGEVHERFRAWKEDLRDNQ